MASRKTSSKQAKYSSSVGLNIRGRFIQAVVLKRGKYFPYRRLALVRWHTRRVLFARS